MLGECLFLRQISQLPSTDLLDIVLKEPVYHLRTIACDRFNEEANMVNDNDSQPFILWPAMNREPQAWLPVLLARVIQQELKIYLAQKNQLIVIGVPKSATWYTDEIQKNNIFPNALFPQVLKKSQIDELHLDTKDALVLPVPSYVHNRDPISGMRNPQDIFFFEPKKYEDSTLLIFDDAIAEGITGVKFAEFSKNQLGAKHVLIASPMAKDIQGGLRRLNESSYVSGFSVLINVIKTHGQHGKMFFRSGYHETKI
jgi:hypothetical protein